MDTSESDEVDDNGDDVENCEDDIGDNVLSMVNNDEEMSFI